MSDTRGYAEFCSPDYINLKGNQITRLSCDVDPSNIIVLELNIFVDLNK